MSDHVDGDGGVSRGDRAVDRDSAGSGTAGPGSGRAGSARPATATPRTRRPTDAEREAAALELAHVRDRIDELDRRIVKLLNERAALGRSAGRAKHVAGRRAVRDPEREREVLLRVAMENAGPLTQADLLSIYRRILSATRAVETKDRSRDGRAGG